MKLIVKEVENMRNESKDFIPKKPIGVDLFAGKPHDKLAAVIAKKLHDGAVQTIGIEGGWGAGKSNLVKLIKGKLSCMGEMKGKCHFFVYDVWGHNKDRQRESILSELIDFLTKEGNPFSAKTKNKKWNDRLKDILSNKQQVTRTNTPSLSLGVLFSILTLLNIQIMGIIDSEISHLSFLIRVLITVWPIFLILALFIFYFIRQRCRNKLDGFWKNLKYALSETFQVYQDKPSQEESTESTYESVSSARGFRRWMNDIDKDLGNDRLIIVFDNFDRIQDDDILSTWSMLNLFFSTESDDNDYRNISVIVPFDRKRIIRAFSCDTDDDHFVDDYINKTFDLVYRVAKPILSDWKNYFTEMWINAGLSHEPDSTELMPSILAFETYKDDITPRDINALINEVAVIKQVQDEIPERYIVMFVLNKEKILSAPVNAVQNPQYRGKLDYLYANDLNYSNYIAALIYQIDSENAYEVFLQQELEKCLAKGDDKQFAELSKERAFNTVMMHVTPKLFNLDQSIRLIDSIDQTLNLISDAEIKFIWDSIYAKALQFPTNSVIFKSVDGIVLRRIDNEQQKEWVGWLVNSYYDADNFTAIDFASSIDELDKIAESHSLEINVFEFLKETKLSVEQYLSFVKTKGSEYLNYSFTTDESELDTFLANAEVNEYKDPSFVKDLLSKHKLPEFEKSIKSKIADYRNDSMSMEILLRVLKMFLNEQPIKFTEFLSDIDLFTLAVNTDNESDLFVDLLSMFLIRGRNYSSNHAPFTNALMREDNEYAISVFDSIQYYANRGDLLALSSHFTSSELCKNITKIAVENRTVVNRLNITYILERFEEICVNGDIDPQSLLNAVDGWASILKLSNESLIRLPNYFFKSAVDSRTEISKKSIKFAEDFFKKLDKQGWHDIIASNEKLLELVVDIRFNKWNDNSCNAVKETLISIASSNNIIGDGILLNKVIEKMKADKIQLSETYGEILDGFILKRDITAQLFRFFGGNLLSLVIIEDKAQEVLRTVLKASFLDDQECVRIMYDHAASIKLIITKCKPSESSELKKGMRDRMDNDEAIAKLAKAVGVGRYRKKR